MPADFTIKAGDQNPIFSDTLSLSNGMPPPLEDATLVLQMRSLLSGASLTLTGETSITDEVAGDVQFRPSAADTAVPGNYLLSWLVTFPDQSQMTFPTTGFLWLSIEPSLATAPQMIVDLPTVKEHLRITAEDRGRDAKLMRIIAAITPLIEAVVGPVAPKVFEEWHDGGSNLIELLRRPSVGFGTSPVLTLIAISEYRGPLEYPLSLVPSPSFGSIYSAFLDADMGTVTRRTAGGSTLAFPPGRQSVHVTYQAGQAQTPPNVGFAALECVRMANDWTQEAGRGSLAFGDTQEVGPSLNYELSRIIRGMLAPSRRAPSIA